MTPEPTEPNERPCLHCLLVELIDEYFEEYAAKEDNTVDTDEVISAVAKTMAELTAGLDPTGRQEMIERLMREIMSYDAEFRQQDAVGTGSDARH